jgi:kynurenine formamidase
MRRILSVLSATSILISGCGGHTPRLGAPEGLIGKDNAHVRIVDLTQEFDVDSPHWKGDPPMRRKTVYTIARDGFLLEEYCHVGQWGTHVDPPAHFHKGLRTSDEIPVSELILPLVVIDVHKKVENNPDYVLTLDDIHEWENRHGPIPQGSFVAMRTDWSKRWTSEAEMQNRDTRGVAHYPGWSIETLRYLYEVRNITASGHETTDTDPGLSVSKDTYDLESFILKHNRYQVELLANLDQVPEAGGVVFVGVPKVKRGSGFPARAIAIVPATEG